VLVGAATEVGWRQTEDQARVVVCATDVPEASMVCVGRPRELRG
jgi:hypothetical protein